jgi:thioredoxin 1
MNYLKSTSVLILTFCLFFTLLSGSSIAQTPSNSWVLPAKIFASKVKQNPSLVLLDVRSPEEFAEGHLNHAKNIDWNGDSFEKSTSLLAKSKPVYVYCLSGGRSATAAKALRAKGFKEVYELQGGINSWKAADLPLEK